jgi:hypothetical protein
MILNHLIQTHFLCSVLHLPFALLEDDQAADNVDDEEIEGRHARDLYHNFD